MNTSTQSWVPVDKNSDFPIQNLPFGVFLPPPSKNEDKRTLPRVGVAIGDQILDLVELKKSGLLNALKFDTNVFAKSSLNDFISLGKKTTSAVRKRIADLLDEKNKELQGNESLKKKVLVPMKKAKMLMPVEVGDYTDFYSSMEHARNVGTMFRDPNNALLPNWKHIPVGYHGRASSIVVSGTDFHRPKGQIKPPDADKPIFSPTRQMDFELEMAFIIGKPTQLGESIPIEKAEEYIFGMVLFNDWSARDIQSWEYVPLGPFLGKNFCSSVSPWVVTMDALEPFRTESPVQDVPVLDYLKQKKRTSFDIQLEVGLTPQGGKETAICKSNFKYLYWNMPQQLAHHTVNGCNVNVGDMMASGTISGSTPDSFGSMLELCWKGTKPIKLDDGNERKFMQDNDSITMRGYCEKNGLRIGFGEVNGKVLPAK